MTEEFAQRLTDFAASEMFARSFREGMDLVEEAAAYLDGPGREESRNLSRNGALAYAGESMRLTTRLMQVASWLLVQRAVREGEMGVADACDEKYRLGKSKIRKLGDPSEPMPEALQDLIARTDKVFERVTRLDEQLYATPAEPASNAVFEQHKALLSAFGK